MKKVFLSFSVVLVIVALFVPISAKERVVYDRAGIFTESEIEMIEDAAETAYAKLDISVYIVTDDSRYVSYYGDHFRAEYDISDDAVILVITANRENNYDLYTYGKAAKYIHDGEVSDILDADGVYNNIKSGRYAEGAIAFVSESAEACDKDILAYVIIGSIGGLIAAAITFACIVHSYKTKLHSEKYPLDRYATLDLKERRDDFCGSFVTRRRIQSSSGGGGRGGSFHGGGGGSGHRGGR